MEALFYLGKWITFFNLQAIFNISIICGMPTDSTLDSLIGGSKKYVGSEL